MFYVTNNSTKHRREYKTKLDNLGFGGDLEEIVGTAYLAATYLEQAGFDKKKLVYVVGSAGITQELDDVGIKYLPIGVYHIHLLLLFTSTIMFSFILDRKNMI